VQGGNPLKDCWRTDNLRGLIYPAKCSAEWRSEENDRRRRLRGMTSNPAIFEKAITAGDDYKDIINAPDVKSSRRRRL